MKRTNFVYGGLQKREIPTFYSGNWADLVAFGLMFCNVHIKSLQVSQREQFLPLLRAFKLQEIKVTLHQLQKV